MSGPDPHVLLLGGTGFLGQHLTAALLESGFSVAVAGRRPPQLPSDKRVTFLPPYDLSSASFDPWALIAPLEGRGVRVVLNLIARSGGPDTEVWRDTHGSVRGVLRTIEAARSRWPAVRLVQMGSISEYGRAPFQSSYGRAKRAARGALHASSWCDFHVLLGIATGGNPRLVRDLERFDRIMSRSPLLLDGFRLPCLRVDEVACRVASLVRWIADSDPPRAPTVEVRLPHRWLTLRELRSECLGRSNGRSTRRLDRSRLLVCELYQRLRARHDASRRRLALFCRLARLAGRPEQASWNHYALLRDIGDPLTASSGEARPPINRRA